MNQESRQADANALAQLQAKPWPAWDNLSREEKDKMIEAIHAENRKRDAEDAVAFQNKAKDDAWEKLCPPIYREEFDIGKLDGDKKLINLIRDWDYRPEGMLIMGPTGKGKTRSVWQALKRAHYQRGCSIKMMDGIQFANDASAAAYSPDKTDRWLWTISSFDILFIDDFAKRFTPASVSLLFALVERRTARQKPIIITTNLDAAKLEAMIGDPEMSKPLVRRLREFCNPILL